jgi:hypothetical protein
MNHDSFEKILPIGLRILPADCIPPDAEGANAVLEDEGVHGIAILAVSAGLLGRVYVVGEAEASGRLTRPIKAWAGRGAAEAALAYALGYADAAGNAVKSVQ